MHHHGCLCTAKLRLQRLIRSLAILSLVFTAAAVIGTSLPAAAQTPPPETAPQPTAKPATAAAPPAQGATPATVMDDNDVDSILGKEIYSAAGQDMGQIVDVLVDHKGQVRAAIIDFGGFLGVGTRKIAVDWRAIQFAPKSNRIVLALSRDEVRVAPEYKQGEPIVIVGPSATSSPPASGASANASTPPASPPATTAK
jgi:sporulation protein YlmC with PRC-barrel domain